MLENGPTGDPYVQMHLALAARREQLREHQEAIKDPKRLVVSDRLDWSTLVYQAASGLNRRFIEKMLKTIPEEHGIPLRYFVIHGKYRLRGKTSSFDKASYEYWQRLYNETLHITNIVYGNKQNAIVHRVHNIENNTDYAVSKIVNLISIKMHSLFPRDFPPPVPFEDTTRENPTGEKG